LASRRYY